MDPAIRFIASRSSGIAYAIIVTSDRSERALFRMHQRVGFPAVTLRPPFIYGPGNPFYREPFFWDRLRDNRHIRSERARFVSDASTRWVSRGDAASALHLWTRQSVLSRAVLLGSLTR